MTGQMNAKLRLVRCPRCKEVLPELPDIPVYTCGGCGTVLQAKHRTRAGGKELCHDATDGNGKLEADHVPEQKQISCSNQATAPSEGGSSAEASTSRSDDNFQDCNIKQPGDEGFSGELQISSELSCHENGDFSPELGEQEQMEQDKHIGTLDQDTGEGKHEFGDCCSEWHTAGSFSDDFPSSMELTCHETEDSSPEPQSRLSLDKERYTFDHCTRMDKIEHGDCKTGHNKGSSFVSKVSTTEDKHEENDLSPQFGAHGEEGKRVNFSQQDNASVACKFPENVDCCRENSSFTEIACDEHENPTAVVAEDSKDHMAESLKAEDSSDKNDTGSIDAAENPLDESILVGNSLSLDNQHLELSQNIIPQAFDRESSVDSFDKLAVENPSFEVGVRHTDFSKSSMMRSYYAYDGSVSSCDGDEDQIPGRFTKPPRRKFKHSAFTNSHGLHRQGESRVKDFLKNKSEVRYQGILGSGAHDVLSSRSEIRQHARKSLILEENNRYAMKYRQNNQDDFLESRSYGQPGGSRLRVDKEEQALRLSFIPRYFPGGQRNGTPSSYQHNVFQHYSGFCSPDVPSYAEPDKKELLRMVYELKEELSRTHLSKSRYSAFPGDEIHSPSCYNHLAPAEERCADLHYSRYPGRCSQATGIPQLQKISRMVFSGDTADYRHQVECLCLRGSPQDWHCSAQLPSHMMCCNKVHRVDHNGHTCYRGFYSASSSPQHYTGSQFSLSGRETKSDDLRLRDIEIKRHVREKYYSSKRHLMPVAGGIPIVACYKCSALLQLPADFLLSGRRYHRLRCNACRKVMRFSLESGTHIAPNVGEAIAPPPSMVGDCDDSIEQRDWELASLSNKYPHAEPLSCSDDYGLSFDRSCSTEGEPSQMMPPLKPLERNTQNRKTLSSSGSSSKPLEDRKMKSILGEPQKALKNSQEDFESEGPSSKMSKWGKSSSEIEEIPPTSVSPLHSLMGYASASEVIRP